jgi:hypothetical protein
MATLSCFPLLIGCSTLVAVFIDSTQSPSPVWATVHFYQENRDG